MKKLLVLLLAFMITSAQVHASTSDGLKAAFDELTYSLSVEWDQKDQEFYHKKVDAFQAEIKKLKARA